MKIYISGKVTGLVKEEARKKFEHSEQKLIAAGFDAKDIVNPMKLCIDENEDYHIAMDICLAHMEGCQALYIQSDWRDSYGARREITEATSNGKMLIYEECDDDLLNLVTA